MNNRFISQFITINRSIIDRLVMLLDVLVNYKSEGVMRQILTDKISASKSKGAFFYFN